MSSTCGCTRSSAMFCLKFKALHRCHSLSSSIILRLSGKPCHWGCNPGHFHLSGPCLHFASSGGQTNALISTKRLTCDAKWTSWAGSSTILMNKILRLNKRYAHAHTQRKIDRHDRQTDGQTDRERETQRDRETDRQPDSQTDRQTQNLEQLYRSQAPPSTLSPHEHIWAMAIEWENIRNAPWHCDAPSTPPRLSRPPSTAPTPGRRGAMGTGTACHSSAWLWSSEVSEALIVKHGNGML